MALYAKAIMAFFTALGTWGMTAFADNGLNAVEAFGLCGVVVATVGVWGIPNATSNSSQITVHRDTQGRFTEE